MQILLLYSFPISDWERPCRRNSVSGVVYTEFGNEVNRILEQLRSQTEFGNEADQMINLKSKIQNPKS